VAETDWRAEIEAFGKEVAADAHEASAFTVERLEALPESVRNVPDRLNNIPPVDPERVQQSLQQVREATPLKLWCGCCLGVVA
jgi:hypothetical protein